MIEDPTIQIDDEPVKALLELVACICNSHVPSLHVPTNY